MLMDMSILGLKFHYFFSLYPLCFGNTLECVDGHEYLGVEISLFFSIIPIMLW